MISYLQAMAILAVSGLCLTGCGQDELDIPVSSSVGSACGDYYPGGDDTDTGAVYGIEEGKTFPCIVFSSARQGEEDTYIHFAEEHLASKYNADGYRFIVIVVGADHCPGCAVLIENISALADRFTAAGTLFIGAAWCDNLDVTDCDFDLDRAETVLALEGWPVDKWPVTNDSEQYLRPGFSDSFPSAVVIRLSDMRVLLVDQVPSAESLLEMVE